jgi:hypothetical protein
MFGRNATTGGGGCASSPDLSSLVVALVGEYVSEVAEEDLEGGSAQDREDPFGGFVRLQALKRQLDSCHQLWPSFPPAASRVVRLGSVQAVEVYAARRGGGCVDGVGLGHCLLNWKLEPAGQAGACKHGRAADGVHA